MAVTARRRLARTPHRQFMPGVGAICVAVLAAGCSVTGDWQVVDWQATGGQPRVEYSDISFGPRGAYSATGRDQTGSVTSTGTYSWNGLRLVLTPSDGEAHTYVGRFDFFGGGLTLADKWAAPTYRMKLQRRD